MAYVAPSTRVNGDIITATIWNQDVVDNSIAHAVITQDADIIALAGLTSAADKAPYFTGSGAASTMTVTSAARGVLDDTTVAAMRTTMAAFGRVVTQVFTASGTYTPTSGMLYAIIECVGGGGGGGAADGILTNNYGGGGGGAGSYSRKYVTAADIGASKAVTVGTAAAGGTTPGNNGAAGTDVSVGVLCVGKGGSGGLGCNGTAIPSGGAGGVAGTGDVTSAGQRGFPSSLSQVTTFFDFGGSGGSSAFGSGGEGGSRFTAGATAGNAATGYGAGGGGAYAVNSTSDAAGGNGSPGIVIITEFLPQ